MCGQFLGLRGPFPLPPSADHTQSDEGEEEGRGLRDLVSIAADDSGHGSTLAIRRARWGTPLLRMLFPVNRHVQRLRGRGLKQRSTVYTICVILVVRDTYGYFARASQTVTISSRKRNVINTAIAGSFGVTVALGSDRSRVTVINRIR